MNDIRPDLKERLEDIDRQRSAMQKRLIELQEQQESIAALLKIEEERWAALNQLDMPFVENPEDRQNGKYDSPVARFVLNALREHGDCGLPALKRLANREGIPFGRKNPGRVLHFLLTGMSQHGIVERTDRGDWRLK